MVSEHDLPTLRLPSAARRTLREEVTAALRAALISGELRPAVVYSAATLASTFGVSVTPVREALLDLVKEGMFEVVRNRGFRVTALSDRDLDEFLEIRALIEVPMMRRVIEQASQPALTALRPIADEIVAAAERGDLIAYIDADLRFHLGLLALAGNQHLVSVVNDLRTRSRLYGLTELHERGGLVDSAREHHTLLDAIAKGDTEESEKIMTLHINHVRTIWAS